MGDPNTALTIRTETHYEATEDFSGIGPVQKGTLEILVKSEGSHQALLGFNRQRYQFCRLSMAPACGRELDRQGWRSSFSLVNNGVIEAGPY